MSYFNDQDQIERENQEALHLALTPFRILQTLIRTVGFILLLILWLLRNQVGWIVDCGPRSESARQDLVNSIGQDFAPGFSEAGNGLVDVAVDFADRSSAPTGEGSDTVYPFQLQIERQNAPFGGIPFCVLGNPGMFESGRTGWGEMGDPEIALNRKSGRMRRDYETAALMTAALRSALAHLKVGQTLASEEGPTSDLPRRDTYCDPDGADPRLLTRAQLAAYRSATYRVHLYDAPAILIRYISFDVDTVGDPDDPERQREEQWKDQGFQISGMCVDDYQCTDAEQETPLDFYVTYFGDIFDRDAPLSYPQLDAERRMLEMADLSFWLREAKENGIADTAPLVAMHRRAEEDLAAITGEVNSDK